jgi:hypothetical protein
MRRPCGCAAALALLVRARTGGPCRTGHRRSSDSSVRIVQGQFPMTLREWEDLVPYLNSLKDPFHSHAHAGHCARMVGEAIVGNDRIELSSGGPARSGVCEPGGVPVKGHLEEMP